MCSENRKFNEEANLLQHHLLYQTNWKINSSRLCVHMLHYIKQFNLLYTVNKSSSFRRESYDFISDQRFGARKVSGSNHMVLVAVVLRKD